MSQKLLKYILLVLCYGFAIALANRIKCSDIVKVEVGNHRTVMEFTLTIPASDTIFTQVHLSGERRAEASTRLELEEKHEEADGSTAVLTYVLIHRNSFISPTISEIVVATENRCISYCEGEPDPRTNVVRYTVSDSDDSFGRPVCTNYQPLLTPNDLDCGRLIDPRITFGIKMEPGSWPWLVPIYLRNRGMRSFHCGGNIISSRTILTAAHCLVNKEGSAFNPSTVMIFAGHHNLTNLNERGFSTHIGKKIVIYPGYAGVYQHDIALINLATEIEFSGSKSPVCLWSDPAASVIGQFGYVAGWGINEYGRPSNVPYLLEQRIVSTSTCSHENLDSTICVANEGEGAPCRGDSGGGLILTDDEFRYSLRGLVSVTVHKVGSRECDSRNNVLYTDVAQYYDWIIAEMW